MEPQKIIVITPEENEHLQKIFRCSATTVWHAVRYRRDNDIHRRIRKAAVERGNPRMVLVPEFDAIYLTNREDADKGLSRYMVLPFRNGATLEANRDTGLVAVRDKHGMIRGEWHNPLISELKAIEEAAQSL